jgi:hypothetical protein
MKVSGAPTAETKLLHQGHRFYSPATDAASQQSTCNATREAYGHGHPIFTRMHIEKYFSVISHP